MKWRPDPFWTWVASSFAWVTLIVWAYWNAYATAFQREEVLSPWAQIADRFDCVAKEFAGRAIYCFQPPPGWPVAHRVGILTQWVVYPSPVTYVSLGIALPLLGCWLALLWTGKSSRNVPAS